MHFSSGYGSQRTLAKKISRL